MQKKADVENDWQEELKQTAKLLMSTKSCFEVMATRETNSSPEIRCVFVETNLDTRLGVLMERDDIVSTFKEKICKEHETCFPSFGNITISALKVTMFSSSYPLTFFLLKKQQVCFFLFYRVEEKGKMLTGETPLSNPNLLERETKTIKDVDKTKKRKLKSLDSAKRSRKKLSLVDQSSGKGVVEPFAIGKDLEKGEKSVATDIALVDDENESHKDDDVRVVEDINQSADVENEGLNKDDGVDATSESFPNSTGEKKPVTNILVLMAPVLNKKKVGTKNNGGKDADDKASTKEVTEVASSSRNVDHDVVMGDLQENVEKVVKKSTKKSKKKQSSDVVEEA
ncbi:unnamed protein product [Arabidopsis thaliana]|uniref:(thale cress) hypothetical protein n=1 Tax=Arabidopsis thaliana TaxID=3702 RepID=A0A7G2ETY7_ARATH|nr:unnamed protein product [Arabidopsis thaliana]